MAEITGTYLPDHDQWLRWRQAGIGGSDAASVLGLGPYRTSVELWLAKLGALPTVESEAMTLGHLLEPVIVESFEAKTGLRVMQRQLCVTHPTREWMRCTIDGVVDYEGATELWEAKATSGWGWREGIPDEVMIQVQHNMEVCGVDACHLAVLRGDRMQLQVERIERDQGLIDMLVEAEETFWNRYIVPRRCPPTVGVPSEEEALREAYAEVSSDPEGVWLGPDQVAAVAEYRAAQADRKLADDRMRSARTNLMATLGSSEIGLIDGEPAVTWRFTESRRLDGTALRKELPEIYERFTKVSKSRRFMVAGIEEDD
jgi:putative phage-type endonuclease